MKYFFEWVKDIDGREGCERETFFCEKSTGQEGNK